MFEVNIHKIARPSTASGKPYKFALEAAKSALHMPCSSVVAKYPALH